MDGYKNTQEFLTQYLELTLMIKSAIAAQDIDIVTNLLDDKEVLIQTFEQSELLIGEVDRDTVARIGQLENENFVALQLTFNEIQKQSDGNNRQIQSLQNGKKVSGIYHAPYSDSSGNYIDKKR